MVDLPINENRSKDHLMFCLEELDKEIRDFFYIWTIYKQLFATQDQVDLLNKVASDVFHAFQVMVGQQAVLFIGRLLDSAKTGNNKNLSLFSLVSEQHKGLFDVVQLERRLQNLKTSDNVRTILDRRNKQIAHCDWSLRTASSAPSCVSGVEDVLFEIEEIFNSVSSEVFGEMTLFQEMITNRGSDGSALIHRLKLLCNSVELDRLNCMVSP